LLLIVEINTDKPDYIIKITKTMDINSRLLKGGYIKSSDLHNNILD